MLINMRSLTLTGLAIAKIAILSTLTHQSQAQVRTPVSARSASSTSRMSLVKASDITGKGCNTGYDSAGQFMQSQENGNGIGILADCAEEGRNAWTVSLDQGATPKGLQQICEQTGGLVKKYYLGGEDGWVLECHYKN